jgi:hypothetical protein
VKAAARASRAKTKGREVKEKIKKHPDSVAWDKWIDSDEGKSCLDESILLGGSHLKYLKNRLWKAFMAGRRTKESK